MPTHLLRGRQPGRFTLGGSVWGRQLLGIRFEKTGLRKPSRSMRKNKNEGKNPHTEGGRHLRYPRTPGGQEKKSAQGQSWMVSLSPCLREHRRRGRVHTPLDHLWRGGQGACRPGWESCCVEPPVRESFISDSPAHSRRTADAGGPLLPHRSVMTPLAVEPDAEARIGLHNQGAGGNVHSGPQPSRPRP